MLKRDQRVLAYINRARAALGKKPLKRIPKGVRRNACECPIATAVGVKTNPSAFGPLTPHQRVRYPSRRGNLRKMIEARFPRRFPRYVQQWIERFDNGELPEYEK